MSSYINIISYIYVPNLGKNGSQIDDNFYLK